MRAMSSNVSQTMETLPLRSIADVPTKAGFVSPDAIAAIGVTAPLARRTMFSTAVPRTQAMLASPAGLVATVTDGYWVESNEVGLTITPAPPLIGWGTLTEPLGERSLPFTKPSWTQATTDVPFAVSPTSGSLA